MPKIVILDASTLDRGDLDFSSLKKLGDLQAYPRSSEAEIIERCRNAEIVLTNKAKITPPVFDASSSLKLIAVCATGTNNVDLESAKKHGVKVANVAGYSTLSVAQHAFSFILNYATQIHRFSHEPQRWPQSPIFTRLDYPIFELHGKTLGIVGAGKIGTMLGELAETFGMEIQVSGRANSTPHPAGWPRLPIQNLFETSDVISLHCPLTPETRHLMNAKSFGWMKPNSFLVNTGRGDLIDEEALCEALKSGKLGGAGLDVLSVEPPPPNHPLIQLQHPNLMITPHTAWATLEARKRLLEEVVANIKAFLEGKDRNLVA
jgi:glycerate dehydrogenase